MKTIRQKTQEIINDFNKGIEIVGGLTRNTKEIIDRIYFYKNDKFVECSDDNAIFWQMVTPYIDHKAKLLDVDPKDFRPVGQGEFNFVGGWALQKKYYKWVEDENFSVDVDDVTKEDAAFGSTILKIIEGEDGNSWEMCDLRKVAFNQKLKSIRNKPFVEIHELNADQIREKKDVWNNVEKLLNKMKDSEEDATVYEYYGYDEENDNKFVKAVHCDLLDEKEYLFYDDEIDGETPYRDIHCGKYEGMWLRKGMYETCFPEQERANTVVNENAEATAIASLLLLRSTDVETNSNVLRQAISGQIINSADLQQIGIDNRAFSLLLNELDRIDRQVQKKLKLPDIATGDNLPSGTPFRSMAMMSNSYKSAFKQERTMVAQGITDILLEDIFPSLVKKWNRGDMLEIAEDDNDIKLYDKAVENLVLAEYYDKANAEKRAVDPAEEEAVKQHIKEQLDRVGRKVKLEKDLFDFKYGIKLDPTGETYDKAQQNESIVQGLQLILSNPAVAEIPAFKQLMENNGVTPFKLTTEQKQQMMMPAQPMPAMQPNALNSQVDTNV